MGCPDSDLTARHFLVFCGTSNLVALRWVLRFGASPSTHDTNSTTGLHAPRRGSKMEGL